MNQEVCKHTLLLDSCFLILDSRLCFLRFFVRSMLVAPFAVLLQSDFALHLPDILASPVVIALAYGTLQTDKIWLWHKLNLKLKTQKVKPLWSFTLSLCNLRLTLRTFLSRWGEFNSRPT